MIEALDILAMYVSEASHRAVFEVIHSRCGQPTEWATPGMSRRRQINIKNVCGADTGAIGRNGGLNSSQHW
jgi:hypothetical protein